MAEFFVGFIDSCEHYASTYGSTKYKDALGVAYASVQTRAGAGRRGGRAQEYTVYAPGGIGLAGTLTEAYLYDGFVPEEVPFRMGMAMRLSSLPSPGSTLATFDWFRGQGSSGFIGDPPTITWGEDDDGFYLFKHDGFVGDPPRAVAGPWLPPIGTYFYFEMAHDPESGNVYVKEDGFTVMVGVAEWEHYSFGVAIWGLYHAVFADPQPIRTTTLHVHDIAVYQGGLTAGATLGDKPVGCLWPIADGTHRTWVGFSPHWAAINDRIGHEDGGTLFAFGALPDWESLHFSKVPDDGASIEVVQPVIYHSDNAPAIVTNVDYFVAYGGDQAVIPEFVRASTAPVYDMMTLPENPVNAEAWTGALVNATEFGFSRRAPTIAEYSIYQMVVEVMGAATDPPPAEWFIDSMDHLTDHVTKWPLSASLGDAPEVVTGAGRFGTAALEMANGVGSTGREYNPGAIGYYCYIPSAVYPSEATALPTLLHQKVAAPASSTLCKVRVSTAGALVITNSTGAMLASSAAAAVPLQAWFAVEIVSSEHGDALAVYIGHELVVSATGLGEAELGEWSLGNPVGPGEFIRWRFEDFYAGPEPILRAWREEARFPSAPGTYTEWELHGAEANWKAVGNLLVPLDANDDTGYVEVSSPSEFGDIFWDTYQLAPLTRSALEVRVFQWNFRTGGSLDARLWAAMLEHESGGTEEFPMNTPINRLYYITHSIDTSERFGHGYPRPEDIDPMLFGMKGQSLTDVTSDLRVAQFAMEFLFTTRRTARRLAPRLVGQ